jgi:putative transcriptional regulator
MYSLVYLRKKEGILKLGNRLRQYRFENQQISQQDLANAVGVTRLTIHSIEKGKFNPSALLALKISRFFKTKLEDIFYLVKERKEK